MTTLRVDKSNIDTIIKELKEKGEVVPIISDSIFKSLFREEEMKGILSYIISEVLHVDKDYVYENIKVKDSYIKKKNITHKEGTADLIAEIREKEILLEANSKNDTYTRFRNMIHSYGEVVNKVKVASKPEDIGLLFLINFDNENSNAKRLVSRIVMKDDDNEEDPDQIFFQKYRVSIPFARKKEYNIDKLTRLERILLIIAESKKERLHYLAGDDKELCYMVKRVEEMSEDPGYMSIFDEEKLDKLARELDKQETIKKVTEEVTEKVTEEVTERVTNEKNIEIAKKMLKKGLDIKDIIDITGLSKKDIENLK